MLLIINNDYIVIYDVRDAFNNNVKSEMISQSNIYYSCLCSNRNGRR